MTGEACAGSGTAYQITDTTKRVVDPGVAVTVKVNNVALNAADFTLDYTTGAITLASSTTQSVTITGAYIPMLAIAEARSASIMLPVATWADVTRMGDAAGRKLAVDKKCEISLEHFVPPSEELVHGPPVLTFASFLSAGVVFIEAAISTHVTLCGWFAIKSESYSHKIDEALTGSVSFTGVVRTCSGRTTEQALFTVTTA